MIAFFLSRTLLANISLVELFAKGLLTAPRFVVFRPFKSDLNRNKSLLSA